MPINIDLADSRKIITQTNLQACRDGDAILKNEINHGLSILIPRIQGAPPSGTKLIRDKITTTRNAGRNLLSQLGFHRYDPVRGNGTPLWPPHIKTLKAGSQEVDQTLIDRRLTNLVDETFWLISQLETLQHELGGNRLKFPAPNNAIEGKVAVRDFFFDLFPTYQHIFGKPPARSQTISKAPSHQHPGPAIRFVIAILEAIKKRLILVGLEDLAESNSLQIQPTTIEGWIRDYRKRTADKSKSGR